MTQTWGHSYWAEAAAYSIQTCNLILSCHHPGHIPLEYFSGKWQGVAHLHVFGAKCWAKTPAAHGNSKLDPHSTECCLLGYASGGGNYKVQDVVSCQVFVLHNVVFEEGQPCHQRLWVGKCVTFHITDPTLSLSLPKTLRRHIVDHQTLPVVHSLFPSGQFLSWPESSATLPYAKSPLPYPSALHLSTDSIQHMHHYSASWIMVTHGADTICSVSFATHTFHFTICSFHITMCFLIFDILSIMCSLPSDKPLCFSSSYLKHRVLVLS